MAVSTIAVFIIPSLQMASTDCHLPFFFSSASCDLCTNILLGNNGYPWYFPIFKSITCRQGRDFEI